MPAQCIVSSCHVKCGDGKSMYGLPKDAQLRQLWLEAIDRLDITKATHNTRVCEDHFPPGSFVNEHKTENYAKNLFKRLRSNAVPVLEKMNMSGNYITTRDCSRFDKVRFINLVRKQEALYNRQHPHYSDKDYIDPILERIAAEVGLNGCESARNKWKSLKVCYKFHKLNIANPTAKQKKTPLKKWPYFELMKFLDPHTVTRKKEFASLSAVIPEPASVSNCSYPSDASSSHPTNDSFVDAQLNSDQYYVKQEPVFQDALMQMEDHHNHTGGGGGSSDNDWTEAINERHGTTSTAIAVDQAAEIVTAVRESARGVEAAIMSASRLDQDENAQYGRFIASRLRKLTPRQKHKIRKGIEDVFYQMESESHQESTNEILPN